MPSINPMGIPPQKKTTSDKWSELLREWKSQDFVRENSRSRGMRAKLASCWKSDVLAVWAIHDLQRKRLELQRCAASCCDFPAPCTSKWKEEDRWRWWNLKKMWKIWKRNVGFSGTACYDHHVPQTPGWRVKWWIRIGGSEHDSNSDIWRILRWQ